MRRDVNITIQKRISRVFILLHGMKVKELIQTLTDLDPEKDISILYDLTYRIDDFDIEDADHDIYGQENCDYVIKVY